jgi:predicted ATP-dependent Lon-type protease
MNPDDTVLLDGEEYLVARKQKGDGAIEYSTNDFERRRLDAAIAEARSARKDERELLSKIEGLEKANVTLNAEVEHLSDSVISLSRKVAGWKLIAEGYARIIGEP